MERPNKRSKLNDYHERGEERTGPFPPEHGENSYCGDQGYAQHSGEGVQNVHGRFHNGRDFNTTHIHDNNVFINSSFSPQTPVDSNTEEHRRKLLESLKFAQSDTRRTTIKRAHGKTCKWFLETTQYVDWLDVNKFDDHGGLLWIKGKPGAGKSTLMKYTFSHVYQTLRKQGHIVLSFFFNARGEELEKSAIGLYRSLLSQLLEDQPGLQQVLDSTSPGHQWNIDSLMSHLESAICSMKTSSIICFIDALDECEEQQIRSMLSFLSTLNEQTVPTGTKLHVCLASRHYPHITVNKGIHLVIDGREEHQRDITSYLDDNLNIGHSNHAEKIRSELQNKASGVFMWVVLVVDILNKEYDRGRNHSLHQRLKDIPGDLHDLIHNILTRDHDNTDGLLLCIQWVLFAKRPLTPKELYFAIMSGVEPDRLFAWDSEYDLSNDDIRRYLIDNSKGLTELTTDKTPTIQFIHESVRDFLLKENGLQKIWPELGSNLQGKSHDRLRRCCLTYMSNNIVKGFKLPSPFLRVSPSVIANVRQDIADKLPFLEYANRNIIYHADKAESNGITQNEFFEAFVTSLSSFSFNNWKAYDRLFEHHHLSNEKGHFYVLGRYTLPNPFQIHGFHQSSFAVGEVRYGDTESNGAVKALLFMEVQTLPPDSTLHRRLDCLIDTIGERNTIERSFFFSKDVLSHLTEAEEIGFLDVFLTMQKEFNEPQTLFNCRPNHDNYFSLPIQERKQKRNEAIIELLIKNGVNINILWRNVPSSLAAVYIKARWFLIKASWFIITKSYINYYNDFGVTEWPGRHPFAIQEMYDG